MLCRSSIVRDIGKLLRLHQLYMAVSIERRRRWKRADSHRVAAFLSYGGKVHEQIVHASKT